MTPGKRKKNGTQSIRFNCNTFSKVVVMQIGQCYLQLKWGTGDPAVAAEHFLLARDIYTNQENFARLTHNPR